MSRVFVSPLATPFHSLVSIFPIPSRYISIFRAPPPRYFSPSLIGLAEVEKVEDGSAQVLQALPRGQRRRLRVRLPFVASVDNAAPVARQSAFGPARRGEIEAHEVEVVDDPLLAEDSLQPARPRPKRLKVIKAKTGAERMKAATAKASGGTGQVLKDLSAEAGAEAIFKLLREEGVIR